MPPVTLDIDPGLFQRLKLRVKVDEHKSPAEFRREVAKEVRCALQAYLGPDPDSVIHEVKRRERTGEPKPEPTPKIEDIPGISKGMPNVARVPKKEGS